MKNRLKLLQLRLLLVRCYFKYLWADIRIGYLNYTIARLKTRRIWIENGYK